MTEQGRAKPRVGAKNQGSEATIPAKPASRKTFDAWLNSMKQKLPLNAPASTSAARTEPEQSEVSGLMPLDSDRTQLNRVPDDLLGKARRRESVPAEERKTAPPGPNAARSDDHTAVFRPPPELLARSRAAAQARKQAPPAKPAPEPVATPVAAPVAESVRRPVTAREPVAEPAPVVTAAAVPLPLAEHHSLAPDSITTEIALPATSAGHSSEPSLEIGTHYGAEPAAPIAPAPSVEAPAYPSSRPTAPDLSALAAQPFGAPARAEAAKPEEPAAPEAAAAIVEEPAPKGSAWLSWVVALVVLAGVAWLAYKRYYLHQ